MPFFNLRVTYFFCLSFILHPLLYVVCSACHLLKSLEGLVLKFPTRLHFSFDTCLSSLLPATHVVCAYNLDRLSVHDAPCCCSAVYLLYSCAPCGCSLPILLHVPRSPCNGTPYLGCAGSHKNGAARFKWNKGLCPDPAAL